MTASLHPCLPLLAGAALSPLFGKRLGGAVSVLAALGGLWAVAGLPSGEFTAWRLDAAGVSLTLLRVDRLAVLFAWIFTLAASAACLFSFGRQSATERAATLAYAGAALGAVFAGDLVTLYVFWELMALTAMFVILAGNTPKSRGAAFRYALVHLFGGVCLIAGLALVAAKTGSTAFDAAALAQAGPGALLILAGFLINASAFPFSAWLADSYPESSSTGGVFLSAFTTKTAVYVLIRGFPGVEALIYAGCLMILYGLIYALRENDLRRILSYSITNQVGFMLVGVGLGTPAALNGAAALAFCHILYKSLLFMGAGAVIEATGRRRLTELGGLFSAMPLTFVLTAVGAMSLSALPGTCGFVSKPMVLSAAADADMALTWLFLEAASAGTVLYAGLAVPYFVFFGPRRAASKKDPPVREAPPAALLGMGILALSCLLLGMYPAPLLALLPYPAPALAPFSLARIAATFELLAFAGLFFAVYAPVLRRQPGITLDTDWFYRAGGPVLYRFADTAGRGLGAFFSDLIARTATALDRFTRHGPSRLASLVVGLFSPLLGKDAERLRQEAARAAATWTIPSGVTLAAALAGLCLILALVV